MAGPNSQNQYTPQAIPLDGGLDFITPKVMVDGGTASACLNFERTDRKGYSRIKGYEKFDGSAAPSLAYTNIAYILHEETAGSSSIRDAIFIQGSDIVLGYIYSTTTTVTAVGVTNFDEWRIVLAAINAGNTITLQSKTGESFVVEDVQSFDEYQATLGVTGAKNLTVARNDLFRTISNVVEYPGPANKPVIGLHGYRDQVYAIKDLATFYFEDGQEQVFVNDIIWPTTGGEAANQLRVLGVEVLSGTWGGGDAAGKLQVMPAVGLTTVGLGSYDVVRPPMDTATMALTLAAAPPGVDMSASDAGMWRSNNYEQAEAASISEGWENIDLGYLLQFENGTSVGPPVLYNRGVGGSVTTDVTEVSDVGDSGSTTASNPAPAYSYSLVGAASIAAALADESITSYERTTINSTSLIASGNIIISDFDNMAGFAADANIEVKGVKVEVKARFTYTDTNARIGSLAVQPTSSGSLITGSTYRGGTLPSDITLPAQDIVTLELGGEEDLWGLDAATMKTNLNSNFGFAIQPYVSRASGSYKGIIDVFFVRVTVYFTTTITEYYFWNGVDDVTAKITDVFVTEGSWDDDDAQGYLQVADVVPVGSATRNHIALNDEIRTSPGGAGLRVADIKNAAGAVAYNGLATLAELEEYGSRYRFITANFFADENFEAIYGVSGARRAFTYDGFYFNTIFTQGDEDKDRPRHVTAHQFHLALGYRAGAVLLSVAGQPRNFLGIEGASEVDTGDPVTGFAKMNGTTLGIFCKDSIHGLVGTSPDNFSLSILSPYEGAIEYTVVDVGKPIYCSYRGISLFDQTAAYGDFSGARLSYAVTPWLAPRLQGTISPVGTVAAASGPVVAVACRTTNQYRLYFGDGYRLTMSLAGAEQAPMFTIQAEALFSNTGPSGLFRGYVVPRAESSFVDSKGAERIHISPYSKSVTQSVYHVLEYEKSWTFDAHGIPAYIVTNENFFNSPFNYDNVRKMRLHGLSLGYAPMKVHVDKEYGRNEANTYAPRVAVDCSLPRDPTDTMYYDLEPITSMSDLATRGRSFSMRFMSYNTSLQPTTVKDPVLAEVAPPFVIQAMLLQNTENKADT